MILTLGFLEINWGDLKTQTKTEKDLKRGWREGKIQKQNKTKQKKKKKSNM